MKREARKRKWVRRLNWCYSSVEGIIWMSIAVAVLYYTNFFRTCWEDPRVDWTFFGVGLFGIGINMALLFYLAIYIPYIEGKDIDPSKEAPTLVKIMAITGVLTFFW